MTPLHLLLTYFKTIPERFTTNIKALPQKVRQGFWWSITTDKVRPFVWVYYIWLFAWGVYGTFFSEPITFVEPSMGGGIYTIWMWLHLVGPILAMTGLRLEAKSTTGTSAYYGVNFQAGGHACMFLVLLSYELAALDQSYFGRGTYSIFVIAPYVLGCLLLFLQASVKLFLAEALKRAIERGDVDLDELDHRGNSD